jgi:hypothetical protein
MAQLVKWKRKDKPQYFNFGYQLDSGWVIGISLLNYQRDYYQLLANATEIDLNSKKSKKGE